MSSSRPIIRAPFTRTASQAANSSPLSVQLSNILANKNSSRSMPSYRYRAPLQLLQSHIDSVLRPSHFSQKWFHGKTGSLSNSIPVESLWPSTYFENAENSLNVPTLQHGLDEVLKTGNVHLVQNLQDPSNSYFDVLRDVNQPETLDYTRMSPFMPPSQDKFLHNIAKYSESTFAGSTSSMTAALSAFYLLISNFKSPYANMLPSFQNKKFTNFSSTVVDKPRILMLRPQQDFNMPKGEDLSVRKHFASNANNLVYTLDNDSFSFVPINLILTKLGHSLERALTYDPQEFSERFVMEESTDNFDEEADQAYHYTRFGNFVVRSQLDCFDPNLKDGRGGIFDLKTRATAPIRFNMKTYDKFIKREQITSFVGEENSFEKEFHDMVRNAFIKYSYQALLGRMDGMFMAYHNTSEMYGFEYLPLEEMNTYVFGSDFMARKGLIYSMQMLNHVCQLVTNRFPGKAIRLIIRPYKNRELKTCEVIVYAHVVEKDEGWMELEDDTDMQVESFYEDVNPFNIPDNVVAFRVGTHATKNGRSVNHDLSYRETDDVNIDYYIEELSNVNNSLTNDVIRMMKMEVISNAPGKAALELARRLRETDKEARKRRKPTKDM